MHARAIVTLTLFSLLAIPSLLRSQTDPPPPDPLPGSTPLGNAISVPTPDDRTPDVKRYEIPELAGARPANGSQLEGGALPAPYVDYTVSVGSGVENRISIFETGLVVVHMKTSAGRLLKRVLLPKDAFDDYREWISRERLELVDKAMAPLRGTERRAVIRVYDDRGYAERIFDPSSVLPRDLEKMRSMLQDLERVIAEDREVTNPMADYQPKLGDRLVADDQKIYRVTSIIADGSVVELTGTDQPVKIYFATKDLHHHFIASLGGGR